MIEISESFIDILRKRSRDRIKNSQSHDPKTCALMLQGVEVVLGALGGMCTSTKSKVKKIKLVSVND